jgi:exopolysaccharide biosynthesis glucuronosyltransferase PssE
MKIFVTVGTQLPFDRLIVSVDVWAAGQSAEHSLFAQVGEQGYRPAHMEFAEVLEPTEFKQRVLWADVLVAHAGMGSILTALQYGKPILVMPRQGRLKEHRNDHQVATAQRFREMGKVAVAMDENEIPSQLDGLAALERVEQISDRASDELIAAIRGFIHGKET